MKARKTFSFRAYRVSYNWCEDLDQWYSSRADAADKAREEVDYKVYECQQGDWYDHRHTIVPAGRYEACVWSNRLKVTLDKTVDEDGEAVYTYEGRVINTEDVRELAEVACEMGVEDEDEKLVKTIKNKRA